MRTVSLDDPLLRRLHFHMIKSHNLLYVVLFLFQITFSSSCDHDFLGAPTEPITVEQTFIRQVVEESPNLVTLRSLVRDEAFSESEILNDQTAQPSHPSQLDSMNGDLSIFSQPLLTIINLDNLLNDPYSCYQVRPISFQAPSNW